MDTVRDKFDELIFVKNSLSTNLSLTQINNITTIKELYNFVINIENDFDKYLFIKHNLLNKIKQVSRQEECKDEEFDNIYRLIQLLKLHPNSGEEDIKVSCRKKEVFFYKALSSRNFGAEDNDGKIILHHFVNDKDLSCFTSILILSRAYINTKDNDGNTPLHLLKVEAGSNRLKSLHYSGVDHEIRNNHGETFSDLCSKRGQYLAEFLSLKMRDENTVRLLDKDEQAATISSINSDIIKGLKRYIVSKGYNITLLNKGTIGALIVRLLESFAAKNYQRYKDVRFEIIEILENEKNKKMNEDIDI